MKICCLHPKRRTYTAYTQAIMSKVDNYCINGYTGQKHPKIKQVGAC
jgi:hypothetical protein